MSYICTDRGSQRCPCALMEAGQCYTCNMIKTGKCNCSPGWQGVCPYTEYKQRGEKTVEADKSRRFMIESRSDLSPDLTVVTLKVPFAYALKCKELGSFVIVESGEWMVPLSILQSITTCQGGDNYISFAIGVSGPKTINLVKQCSVGTNWNLKGPYYNGIINSEKYDRTALSIVVGKGIAFMPFLNQKDKMGGSLANLYLDVHKLPPQFIQEYMPELDYEEVDLQKNIEQVSRKIKKDYEYCLTCMGLKPNVLFMVSPYYVDKLLKSTMLPPEQVIYPNHSNMCCGIGLCGACSYTDGEGTTVRGCKCNDM